MILLPGQSPDHLVHPCGGLVVVISPKAGALARRFGLDNCDCCLPSVRDVQSWVQSPSPRFFQTAIQLTLCLVFAVSLPQEPRKKCIGGVLTQEGLP